MSNTDLRETVEAIKQASNTMADEMARNRKQTRRNSIGNWVIGVVVAAVAVVGGWVYYDDQRDDRELACQMVGFGNAFTDAAVRANPEADPVQVEAFRDDLLSHLPPCEED